MIVMVMNIQRIVSLAPSNTEVVFALGKGSKLAGVTECCNYPLEAKSIQRIGGFATPNMEKITSLRPDVVLATAFRFHSRIVPQLGAIGIPAYVVKSETILDTPGTISFVGKLIGCQEKAAQLAMEIQKRIEKISQKVKAINQKPKVCYMCSHDPLCIALKSCTIGKLIEVAGGQNLMQDINEDNIDDLLEAVIKGNPQAIITSKGHRGTADLLSYVKKKPRFKQTNAYVNNRIYQIDAELICRPGPRAIRGLETLAKFIHPEIQ